MAEILLPKLKDEIGNLLLDGVVIQRYMFPDGTECTIFTNADEHEYPYVYCFKPVLENSTELVYEKPPARSERDFSANLVLDAIDRFADSFQEHHEITEARFGVRLND
jgi:hypothetical protein